MCDSVADQIDQLPGFNCLNYPNVIRPLVMKLPKSIQRKWDKRVVEFALLKDDLYPDFKEFAAEVKKRARLKNHPNVRTYGNQKTDQLGKRKVKDAKKTNIIEFS